MDNKITVVINTYNAERYLSEVLQSVKDFDEVLVCDMESTDTTCKIASEYGCRIVTFPKGDAVSAEPARTFAIQQARSEWVLVVDADELVTPQLRDYLYAMIQKPDCPAGIAIPRHNRFMLRYTKSLSLDRQLRFFRRQGIVWPEEVHTFPHINGKVSKIPASATNVRFVHLADDTISTLIRKTNQYTESEMKKRANRNYGLLTLFTRPMWRFMRNYIFKMGFRDGVPGLIHAGMDAFYQFILVAKILEQKYRNK